MFGRNGKQNMAENPFARSERSESESYYRAPWIFRQILLVVEPKHDFHAAGLKGFHGGVRAFKKSLRGFFE